MRAFFFLQFFGYGTVDRHFVSLVRVCGWRKCGKETHTHIVPKYMRFEKGDIVFISSLFPPCFGKENNVRGSVSPEKTVDACEDGREKLPADVLSHYFFSLLRKKRLILFFCID